MRRKFGQGHDTKDPIPHYRLIDTYRFLLASLNIEAILQESTIYRRRERFRKMRDGLGLGDVSVKQLSGWRRRVGVNRDSG